MVSATKLRFASAPGLLLRAGRTRERRHYTFDLSQRASARSALPCNPRYLPSIIFAANASAAGAKCSGWGYQVLSLRDQRRRRLPRSSEPIEKQRRCGEIAKPGIFGGSACRSSRRRFQTPVYAARLRRRRESEFDQIELSMAAPTSIEEPCPTLERRLDAFQPNVGPAVRGITKHSSYSVRRRAGRARTSVTRYRRRESTENDEGKHAPSTRRASAMDQSKGGW
jgi:hypothetical protein